MLRECSEVLWRTLSPGVPSRPETDGGEATNAEPRMRRTMDSDSCSDAPSHRKQIGTSPQSGTPNKTCNDCGKLLLHAHSCGRQIVGRPQSGAQNETWIEKTSPAHPLTRTQIGTGPRSGTPVKTRDDCGKLLLHALSYRRQIVGRPQSGPPTKTPMDQGRSLAHPLLRKQMVGRP